MYIKSKGYSERGKILQDLADLGIKVIVVTEDENEKPQSNGAEAIDHQKVEMIHHLKAERERLHKHWKEAEQEQKIRADSIAAIDKAIAKADRGNYYEVAALIFG